MRWIAQSRQLSSMRFSWPWLQQRASCHLVPSGLVRSVLVGKSRQNDLQVLLRFRVRSNRPGLRVLDWCASSCSADRRAAAESSPEVAHGGKMVGRNVAFLRASFVAGTAGVSLRTWSGELTSHQISSLQDMWVSSVFGCTHLSASVYLIKCLHSDQIVVMCVLFVHFRHFFQHCWRVVRKTWRVFDMTGLWRHDGSTWRVFELKRIWLEILHLDLALEGDAEHPDARCGWVTIDVRAFNETITTWSILDQVVLMRQLRDDLASERYGNGFVSAEESRLHAIVRCLKLASGVWWSP